jgi:hypothetical protein
MTDIDRAAIRARIRDGSNYENYKFGPYSVNYLAHVDAPALFAALEDAERERDALAAVVEQVRIGLEQPLDPDKVLDSHAGRALWQANLADHVRVILKSAPAVALEAVKAEAAAIALEKAADELTNKPFVKSWPVSWMPANTLGGAAAYLRAYAGECRETTESEGN